MPRHHMGDVRKGVMVTSAMAMTAVLASAGVASAAVPTAESTTERVLQSVNVTMGPDGTTTAVDSSVVRTDGTAEDAEASDDAFSPSDVVGDLPVRVLTSWRTSEGAGTDLSDLQGYTGRVAIDLTIQNLTVKPEILTYDAAGTSRQQAALVGSPLTVVASTALGDVKADRLVSDDKGTGVNVTNGVIGKGADGTTVQWAALLAPPTLSATSEFSLVLDAKDFDVPSFDLSVQPGLVTDPSMGALVDAAFNPASSEELDLQRRTIELIGEVNGVLARASDTIGDVRTSLTSSAETLGTQTVADLRSSTQSVTTNMSSLGSALQGLQGDLNSTLESTGSSAVAELEQAVTVVNGLLGDTSQGVQPAAVRVDGCESTVAPPRNSSSVYGNLVQVASQLDGYAKATETCKVALKAAIVRTIGPDLSDEQLTDEQREELCKPNSDDQPRSVTCSLYVTQQDFDVAAEALRVDLQKALALLEPSLYEGAREAANDLIEIATGSPEFDNDGIEGITKAINGRRGDMVDAIQGGYDLLKAADENGPAGDVVRSLDAIAADLNASKSWMQSVRTELIGDGDDSTLEPSMQAQNTATAVEVCRLVADGLLDANAAKTTLGYLVDDASCVNGNLSPAAPFGEAMSERIADQATVVNSGLAQVNATLSKVAASRGDVVTLANELGAVAFLSGESAPDYTDEEEENPTLKRLFDQLNDAFVDLEAQSGVLDEQIVEIERLAGEVEKIESGIDTAVENALAKSKEGIGQGTEDVVKSSGAANDELEAMFDRSSKGLRAAGGDVVRNGKKSVNQQKSSFFTAQEQAANRVTQTVKDGLGQINSGVNASTRDMEAATTLLVADLRKVLLDLGQREIGGAGLLGSMATNAATARQADYQLALAGSTASAYANVRDRDIAGLMLRQEQTDAAMDSLTRLPAFQLELPSGSQHRTVYSFSIEDN